MSANGDTTRLRRVMVGWLYADLTLVLFIASMGQFRATATAEPKPAPTVSMTTGQSPTPAPTPKPTHERVGLAPKAITFAIQVNRTRLLNGNANTERHFQRDVSRRLKRAVRQHSHKAGKPADKARIGLAIIFGFDNDLGRAQQVARAANRLTQKSNRRLFAPAIIKTYGDTTPANKVDYEIYFYW